MYFIKYIIYIEREKEIPHAYTYTYTCVKNRELYREMSCPGWLEKGFVLSMKHKDHPAYGDLKEDTKG